MHWIDINDLFFGEFGTRGARHGIQGLKDSFIRDLTKVAAILYQVKKLCGVATQIAYKRPSNKTTLTRSPA
jgi:hypothetical protein